MTTEFAVLSGLPALPVGRPIIVGDLIVVVVVEANGLTDIYDDVVAEIEVGCCGLTRDGLEEDLAETAAGSFVNLYDAGACCPKELLVGTKGFLCLTTPPV